MTPKVTNKDLLTDSKEMKICDLPNKEFKIIFLKNLNEMQKNTNRQNQGKNTQITVKFNKIQKPKGTSRSPEAEENSKRTEQFNIVSTESIMQKKESAI